MAVEKSNYSNNSNKARSRGGKRTGAGRPPGIHTPIGPMKQVLAIPAPLTAAGQALVQAPNDDPVSMMMLCARNFLRLVEKYAPGQPDANEDMHTKYSEMALNAFAKAAPYLRNRLATVTHVGNEGAIKIEAINVAIANLRLEDLATLEQLLAPVASASRVAPAVAGRGAEEAPRTIEG